MVEGGGYSNIKLVYMCRTGFKMGGGGLGSGPSLKMGRWGGGGVAFRAATHGKNKDFGAKNNKETYISLKGGYFRSVQVGKAEQRIEYF